MSNIIPPTILQLEVTKNCNNACIMCHKGQMESGQDFDRTDISDIVIKQVKPIYPYLKYAMLFGDGEPILYKGFWDIISDIRTASPLCSIDFINNGSLMNKLNIRKCMDYEVTHIALSMGGASEKTHNHIRKLSKFNQVVENFKNLKKAKEDLRTNEPYLTTMIVVMKTNYKELPEFIRLADELGCLDVEFQQLFITHSMVELEAISSDEVEPFFEEAQEVAKSLGIGLRHYPLESGNAYFASPDFSRVDDLDRHFIPKLAIHPYGYCKYGQPWNSVYVLHNGIVVPDCHWWTSQKRTHLNECGKLDENTDILDIWNGANYKIIRDNVREGNILPQCRGCGLAGGIFDQYRNKNTDHTNPMEEEHFKPHLIQVVLPKSDIVKSIKELSTSKNEQKIFKGSFL